MISRACGNPVKASPIVFKDLKIMKNTDLSVKILLLKC